MYNPTTIPLNMSPFSKKSMKNLKILFLLLFFKISFVGLTQNIYKIGLIHLYSYHSFETKCERNIKNCPKRKLKYDKIKRHRKRKFNSMSLYTDIAVEKKYISEFYKCIFYDKNLEFITLSNDDEIYKSFLHPGPCYPFGTFLMTFFDRKNKMIKQIKIDSFEDLQKIFAAYMEQFSSEKDRHFLKEKLIPHLLSGYEFDLYIRNSTN
jgi:hypothetical protein